MNRQVLGAKQRNLAVHFGGVYPGLQAVIVLYYFNLLQYKPQSRENTVAALYI